MTSNGDRDLVVGAIIIEAGRVLLGNRHPAREYYPACWDVPGRHVEAGEHSQAALQRELRQEIGIEVDLRRRAADVWLVGDGDEMQLWIVRSWHGDPRSPRLVYRLIHGRSSLSVPVSV